MTATSLNQEKPFIPAAGHDWMLPLYDPLVKLLGVDKARRKLLESARISPHDRILDVGCGTGSLVLLVKQMYPDAEVFGLDPDAKALARAKRKLARAGLQAEFDQGYADQLSYEDDFFEHVFSTFMFHHLERDTKQKTLVEIRRVLKVSGTLHLLDFNPPQSHAEAGWLTRKLHSSHLLQENTSSHVLSFLQEAGFKNPALEEQGKLLFWSISFYKAEN